MIAVFEEDWGVSDSDCYPPRDKYGWRDYEGWEQEKEKNEEKEKRSWWDKFWGS